MRVLNTPAQIITGGVVEKVCSYRSEYKKVSCILANKSKKKCFYSNLCLLKSPFPRQAPLLYKSQGRLWSFWLCQLSMSHDHTHWVWRTGGGCTHWDQTMQHQKGHRYCCPDSECAHREELFLIDTSKESLQIQLSLLFEAMCWRFLGLEKMMNYIEISHPYTPTIALLPRFNGNPNAVVVSIWVQWNSGHPWDIQISYREVHGLLWT